MKGKIQIIVLVLVATLIMTAFIAWTNQRDIKMMEVVEKYENCVEIQTGLTPIKYKELYGQYPECK